MTDQKKNISFLKPIYYPLRSKIKVIAVLSILGSATMYFSIISTNTTTVSLVSIMMLIISLFIFMVVLMILLTIPYRIEISSESITYRSFLHEDIIYLSKPFSIIIEKKTKSRNIQRHYIYGCYTLIEISHDYVIMPETQYQNLIYQDDNLNTFIPCAKQIINSKYLSFISFSRKYAMICSAILCIILLIINHKYFQNCIFVYYLIAINLAISTLVMFLSEYQFKRSILKSGQQWDDLKHILDWLCYDRTGVADIIGTSMIKYLITNHPNSIVPKSAIYTINILVRKNPHGLAIKELLPILKEQGNRQTLNLLVSLTTKASIVSDLEYSNLLHQTINKIRSRL